MVNATENIVIKRFLEDRFITTEEYDILFCSKEEWFSVNEQDEQDWEISNDKQIEFWEAIKKIKYTFEKIPPIVYDFSFIKFPISTITNNCFMSRDELLSQFSSSCIVILFYRTTFYGKVTIGNNNFKVNLDFREAIFKDEFSLFASNLNDVDFSGARFYKKSELLQSTFNKGVKFTNTTFFNSLIFTNLTFEDNVNLQIKSTVKSTLTNLTFKKIASFGGAVFIGDFSLKSSIFNSHTDFTHAMFIKDKNDEGIASFFDNRFDDVIYFDNTTFLSPVLFSHLHADTFALVNTKITKILIKNSFFKHANIVDLYAIYISKSSEKKELLLKYLLKENIQDRETARTIKQIFDKQGNIPDSNNLYAIEQEFYLNELVNNSKILTSHKWGDIFVVTLNKYISQFGTNWSRPLFLLFILSYFFMQIYINLDGYLITSEDSQIKHFTKMPHMQYIWVMLFCWGLLYLSTFFKSNKLIYYSLIIIGVITGIIGITTYDDVLAIQNYIIQLTNPINAFKNMNLYEGIEVYGAFVRIIVVTIIYQFLVAFRQNTRRK